jgi:hypothetical protein
VPPLEDLAFEFFSAVALFCRRKYRLRLGENDEISAGARRCGPAFFRSTPRRKAVFSMT